MNRLFNFLAVVVFATGLVAFVSGCSSSSSPLGGVGDPCVDHEDCRDDLFCGLDGRCYDPGADGDADGDSDGDGDACVDDDGDGYDAATPLCESGDDCHDGDDSIHPGAEEVCGDSIDNNCDGTIDESCPCIDGALQLCSSVGDPASLTIEMICEPGIQYCIAGVWSDECIGEVGPREETCNGLDDDCDGAIDEGLLNPLGECDDGTPPPPEDCGPTGEGNGIDDNGDGDVDEGCSCVVPEYDPDLPRRGQPCYGGPIYTLGVGVCHGGTRDCIGGTWGACEGQVVPSDEVCGDEEDNDCDGFVDETCPDCTEPVDEVCDFRDNDCDGLIDEGVRNGCGGCGEVAEDEICDDGLDNNCNGDIDEGCGGCVAGTTFACYAGPPEAAGVGICEMGERECYGEFWGECEGWIPPAIEICGPDGGNGIDEDCDGLVDEDCGCADGETRFCGDAAGTCEYGLETCASGEWDLCTGGVEPAVEVCDGVDNDCDGLTDEGLLNACGTCGESCYELPMDPTDDGESDEGVAIIAEDDPENPTGRDGITLTRAAFIPPYLWAANHTHNTVTKFNTDTLAEEGIYWVGNNPSRTAVDLNGNMWVGGRNDGRLTNVMWDTSACPDRNGDGSIQTSYLDGTGRPVLVNSASDPLADECVLYSGIPNTDRRSIRGVAAGPDGRVWIGYTGGGVQSIDPVTFTLGTFHPGTAVQRYDPDGSGVMQPTPGATYNSGGVYGLVVDADGYLYTSSYNRNTLARFNTVTEEWEAVFIHGGASCSYGIAVDGENRIFLGGWPGCGGVAMFDPSEMRFYTFVVPAAVGPSFPGETTPAIVNDGVSNAGGSSSFYVTGVGVEPATGDLWCSFYALGYTGRLAINEADIYSSSWTLIGTSRQADNSYLPGVSSDLRGVGFDHNGFAWTLGLGSDRVFMIDPSTNERAAALPTGMTIGVGSHYTYSDFTGSTALSFTAPRGFWSYEFDFEFDEAQVDAIYWEAYVPAGTTAGIRIRPLDATGAVVGPWLPGDVAPGVPGYFEYPTDEPFHRVMLADHGGPLVGNGFETQIRLTTGDRDVRPIVHDVRLEWQRP